MSSDTETSVNHAEEMRKEIEEQGTFWSLMAVIAAVATFVAVVGITTYLGNRSERIYGAEHPVHQPK